MNIRIAFFLCVLKHVASDMPSPRGYYGEHFLEFSTKMRQDNVFLQTIFDNVEAIKNSSELCFKHLETYRESLRSNTFWAMRYFDSSGSALEPGWLTGNTVNLGAYDECVSQKTNESFPANYCWLNVQLEGDDLSKTWLSSKHNPLVFSLCVPQSCSEGDLHFLTEPLGKELNFSLDLYCQSARPSMTTTDYVSLCFFVLVVLFTISTVILTEDWVTPRKNRFFEFWKCFDVYGNLKALSSNRKGENALACLYGIRFLSQCCIVLFHVIFMNTFSLYPLQNKFMRYDELTINKWIGSFEIDLRLAVDTFFLLGGTVLSYNCMKRKTKLNLLKYYIHRYIRLTPALLAMVLIVATFYNKMCSGPLSIVRCDTESSKCGKYWWSFFFYIGNWFHSCLIHTWYLATDWQLFMFVSPFVVMVINKMPQHIYKLIALIFTFSLAYSVIMSVVLNIQVDIRSDVDNELLMRFYYNTPMVRAGPWAIGLFLGVLLNEYHSKPKVFSKVTIFFGWLFCAVFLVFCSGFFRLLTETSSSLWLRVAFNTFNSNLFVTAVAWLVFACSTNIAGPIGRILSAPAFEPLGKLSYSMYLVHMSIIYVYSGDIRTPSFYSATHQIILICGLIVISTFSALLLYLTFEAPFMHIEKLIFRRDNTRKADSASLTTSAAKLTGESKVNYNSFQE